MIVLINWYIEDCFDVETGKMVFLARGNVFGHDILQDGLFIHTSSIVEATNDGKNLVLKTYSGNLYRLKFEDICIEKLKYTEYSLPHFNISTDILSECEKLRVSREMYYQKKAEEILDCDELYLVQYGSTNQAAYFKNANGVVHKQRCCYHFSTNDSYLIRGQECELDFRYWFTRRGLKIYHWSNNLKKVKIENVGKSDFEVNAGKIVICKMNEITTIESGQYYGEGLLSPDSIELKRLLQGCIEKEY